MIYEIVMALLILFIGAFGWFAMDSIISNILDRIVIPASVSGGWIGFFIAVKNWFPLVILLSVLMWMIYQSQRPEQFRTVRA